MSYAVSTTLFDSTDSGRIPRDLPRTWSIYESRSLRVLRHPESRRETNGSLSATAYVTIVLDASVACLRSPEIHENRELGTMPERQRDTKMATATERPVRGRNRVRGVQNSDGQPHRYSLPLTGDDPRSRPLDNLGCDTQNDNDKIRFAERLQAESARTRVIPWISRSRVDSGVNSARRGARISGQ